MPRRPRAPSALERRDRQQLSLGLRGAVRVDRVPRVAGGVADAVGPPSVEDLVGRDEHHVDAAPGAGAGELAGGGAVAAQRELRVARAAVHVRPGGGVDDDLGPLGVQEARPADASVSVSRSSSGWSQPIGPRVPVKGAFSSASASARPSRPLIPTTATRTAAQPAWPCCSTARPAARRAAVLALVVAVPVAAPRARDPLRVVAVPGDRRGEARPRRRRAAPSRERPAWSRPSRSGGRGPGDPARSAPGSSRAPRPPAGRPMTSRLGSSFAPATL